MEGTIANIAFPEDLVERIVAKLPFPSILKAQFLSKSWQAKFGPISSLLDEEQKRKARAFHKVVAECTTHWETFLPVATTELDLIGYTPTPPNDVSVTEMDFSDFKQIPENERRLRSLAFLPIPAGSKWRGAFLLPILSDSCMQDRILYGTLEIDGCTPEVYLSSVLNTRWRLLPRPPRVDMEWYHVRCMKLVRDTSESCCKVILFCERSDSYMVDDHFCVQIYDSESGNWSSRTFQLSGRFRMRPTTSVYHNGVLYMATISSMPKLLAFNVQTWALDKLEFVVEGGIRGDISISKLMVCKGRLTIMGIERFSLLHSVVRVLEADMGSSRLSEVVRCNTGVKMDAITFRGVHASDMIWDIRAFNQKDSHRSPYDYWTITNLYIPGTVYRWSYVQKSGAPYYYILGCRYGATVMSRHPRSGSGYGAKVRYMTQEKVRPPSFVVFVSGAGELEDTDLRFLASGLREDMGLSGIPLRKLQRTTEDKLKIEDS